MENKLIIKKCRKCGAIVKVINDCDCNNCGIKCCNENMEVLVPNSVDASIQKHIPVYEVIGDEILVKVNHVMEKAHFIEWICLVDENNEYIIKLNADQKAEAKFKYIPGSVIYAYCNIHGLWKQDVK
ncbi:MAG: desulfoferrodoxin family protein [Clostridia bacterium]